MEEPGMLQSMASLRLRHDWATSLSLFTFIHWRMKWQPTPVFLPGESQGWRSLVGCHLCGCRVGHNWSDLAAAAAGIIIPTVITLSLFSRIERSNWGLEKRRGNPKGFLIFSLWSIWPFLKIRQNLSIIWRITLHETQCSVVKFVCVFFIF